MWESDLHFKYIICSSDDNWQLCFRALFSFQGLCKGFVFWWCIQLPIWALLSPDVCKMCTVLKPEWIVKSNYCTVSHLTHCHYTSARKVSSLFRWHLQEKTAVMLTVECSPNVTTFKSKKWNNAGSLYHTWDERRYEYTLILLCLCVFLCLKE